MATCSSAPLGSPDRLRGWLVTTTVGLPTDAAFVLTQKRGGRCEELTLGAPLYIVIVELAGSKDAQRVTAPYLSYGTRRSMPARGLPWAPAP